MSLLKNVYLFKSLAGDELKMIDAIAETQSINRGDTIFIKGEPARAMYFIKFGSVRIQQSTTKGDEVEVALLGTGSHFGEMAFVDGEVRSATASSAEACELVVIPYDKLTALLDKNPAIAVKLYREMAQFMCGRLRATTNDLNFAREKNLSHM